MDKQKLSEIMLSLRPYQTIGMIREINRWDEAFQDGTPQVSTPREVVDLLSKPEYESPLIDDEVEYFERVFGITVQL